MGDALSDYKVRLDLQLRFRDTDAMGHVNNAVYLSYLELARMKYWETLLAARDYSAVDFILARVEIDYRSPAKLGTELEVGIRAANFKGSSWDFEYRVVEKESGRLVAEARTVQCFYDYAKGRVKRMDPEVRRRLAEFEGLMEDA